MKAINTLFIVSFFVAQAAMAQQSKVVECYGKNINGNVLSMSMSVSEKTQLDKKVIYDAVISVTGKMGGKVISIKNEVVKGKTKTNYYDVVGYALMLTPIKNSILTIAAYTKDASASLVSQDGSEAELNLTCAGIK